MTEQAVPRPPKKPPSRTTRSARPLTVPSTEASGNLKLVLEFIEHMSGSEKVAQQRIAKWSVFGFLGIVTLVLALLTGGAWFAVSHVGLPTAAKWFGGMLGLLVTGVGGKVSWRRFRQRQAVKRLANPAGDGGIGQPADNP